MFVVELLTAAKRWKQPNCPSTGEWINKMWSIQTTEHYSALQRNEALNQAIMWMNLKHTIPNERSQSQKATHSVIPFFIAMPHRLRLAGS